MVPEKIHSHLVEGHWKFLGVGGDLNWKFLGGGVQNKQSSMGEYGYFLEMHLVLGNQ